MRPFIRNQVSYTMLPGIRQLCKAGWVNSQDDRPLNCFSRDNKGPCLAPILGEVEKAHRQPAKSFSASLEFIWGPVGICLWTVLFTVCPCAWQGATTPHCRLHNHTLSPEYVSLIPLGTTWCSIVCAGRCLEEYESSQKSKVTVGRLSTSCRHRTDCISQSFWLHTLV